MIAAAVAEAKLAFAIFVELVLGFLTWLLLLGLLPKDTVNFNVLGSVVLIVLCAVPYRVAHVYVKAHTSA